MSKIIKTVVLSVFLCGFVLFFVLPLLSRFTGPPIMGTGSYEHANQWKDKLTACTSLDDVKQHFNCELYQYEPDGTPAYSSKPYTYKEENTKAIIYDFPDGNWLAMAYAGSHGKWGGGTIVTRDNEGLCRVFFGHVCGDPGIDGNSLEQVYESLTYPGDRTEIDLNDLIEHADSKGRPEGRP